MLIFFCFLAHLFQLLGGELQLKQHLWQEQVKLHEVYSFGFQFSFYMHEIYNFGFWYLIHIRPTSKHSDGPLPVSEIV